MLKYLMVLLLMFGIVGAGSPIGTIGDMKSAIRMESGITNTTIVPDTTLGDICNRSLLWTSVMAGGYEKNVRVIIVPESAFYTMQDSLVEIISGTIVSNTKTYPIKAWPPQYTAEVNISTSLPLTPGGGTGQPPKIYQLWAGRLQLIPVPVAADTLYLKANYEHPNLSADTNTILLTDAFREAAVTWGCVLVFSHVKDYESAAIYETKFEKQKNDLKQTYMPKMDVLSTGTK